MRCSICWIITQMFHNTDVCEGVCNTSRRYVLQKIKRKKKAENKTEWIILRTWRPGCLPNHTMLPTAYFLHSASCMERHLDRTLLQCIVGVNACAKLPKSVHYVIEQGVEWDAAGLVFGCMDLYFPPFHFIPFFPVSCSSYTHIVLTEESDGCFILLFTACYFR